VFVSQVLVLRRVPAEATAYTGLTEIPCKVSHAVCALIGGR
jgi:hypothetical protein